MDTYSWGPGTWQLMHSISFNYPQNPKEEDKKAYTNFIDSLKQVLPCESCKNEFTKMLKKFPLDDFLEDTEGVVVWSYLAHHMVNIRLNKKTPEFNDVVRHYFNKKVEFKNMKEVNAGIKNFIKNVKDKYKKYFKINFREFITQENNEDDNRSFNRNFNKNFNKIYEKIQNNGFLKAIIVLILLGLSHLITFKITKNSITNNKKNKSKTFTVRYD